MRSLQYRCDQCEAVLSDEKTRKELAHISIELNHFGHAKKYEAEGWRMVNAMRGFFQFCDMACLTKYLRARLAESQKQGKEQYGNA